MTQTLISRFTFYAIWLNYEQLGIIEKQERGIMKNYGWTLALILMTALITGCFQQENRQHAGDGSREGVLYTNGMLDDDEILISVYDSDLTRGEAMRQVKMRLGGEPPPDMHPQRVADIRNQVLSRVVDDFVKRELLLREADRLDIQVEDSVVETALQELRSASPDASSLQGILRDGPAGQDSLRNEVVTGLRIEALLKQVLPETKTPDEATIEAFIEEHREKLTLPERAKASHILIATSDDMNDEERAQRRALAESIREQLLDGADFAELATEVSSCPSASRGGDLGTFPRGRMVAPFDEAAFTQPEEEIGEVVETSFGYHIIRVESREEAGVAGHDYVKDILQQRARRLAMADYLRGLQNQADIRHSSAVRAPQPVPEP